MKGIYKITSPSNKIYIGYSFNIKRRFRDYLKYSCVNQKRLYNSLKKYGADKHIYEICEIFKSEATKEFLSFYERIYYDKYVNLGFEMLNLKVPGEKGNGEYSKETKDKMSEVKKKHFPITQFNKDGLFIKYWDDVQIATLKLNIKITSIYSVIDGVIKSTHGFRFIKGKILNNIKPIKYQPRKPRKKPLYIKPRKQTPVYQYDRWVFIKEWPSIKIASGALNIDAANIYQACNGKLVHAGHYNWSRKRI